MTKRKIYNILHGTLGIATMHLVAISSSDSIVFLVIGILAVFVAVMNLLSFLTVWE